jgi:hypothetical protein
MSRISSPAHLALGGGDTNVSRVGDRAQSVRPKAVSPSGSGGLANRKEA